MNPFIGQVSIVAFNYAPKGWAFCNGQVMSIAQNQALFSIIGTTYGGDGIQTFQLPDLRGRAPVHPGTAPLGGKGGTEVVTLTTQQIPQHTHTVNAIKVAGETGTPQGTVWAGSSGNDLQYAPTTDCTMSPTALDSGGQGGPHENMHPSLVVNFIVALSGIYPSRG